MTAPSSFRELDLPAAMLDNLDQLGYTEMTPIQAQALPHILAGHDLIAQASTGSGKTATFGLGLLKRLDPADFRPQALILSPTRELAGQIAQELRRLARFAGNIKILVLGGGAPIKPQAESLAHGAHVVVGTTGRVMDHLERGSLVLDRLHTLVLDEADRMVDMGFFDQVAQIVKACPGRRQTLLFSATYPDNIRKSAARFLKNPVEVKVDAIHGADKIEQHFYEIDPADRHAAVARLLEHFRPVSTLAFCNTREGCRELADALNRRGFSALALHGDLDQRDRDDVLIQFANQSCAVLVATDVAARGLDVDGIGAVINVDITQDAEVHIHRIGRTGRAQERGLALSLCAPHEMRWATLIETYQGTPLRWSDLRSLKPAPGGPLLAPMVTLCIQGGKKDKLRPGDLLGALTGDGGLAGDQVGKINVLEFVTFVALRRDIAAAALARLSGQSIKGRRFRMRLVG